MIGMWLAASAALAQQCDEARLSAPGDHLSVAWVAPRRQRVRRNTELTVVSTVDLRRFVADGEVTVGRLLEHVGLRREGRREPRRPYKVLVFDVPRSDLCRPVSTAPAASSWAGVAVCAEPGPRKPTTDGCGATLDRRTRRPGPALYRSTWGDLVRGGFCVLPAERFVRR